MAGIETLTLTNLLDEYRKKNQPKDLLNQIKNELGYILGIIEDNACKEDSEVFQQLRHLQSVLTHSSTLRKMTKEWIENNSQCLVIQDGNLIQLKKRLRFIKNFAI